MWLNKASKQKQKKKKKRKKKCAKNISRAISIESLLFVCCRFLFTSNDKFQLKLWLFVCGFVFLLSSHRRCRRFFFHCFCCCWSERIFFPESRSWKIYTIIIIFRLYVIFSRFDQIIFLPWLLSKTFICIYSHYSQRIAFDSQLFGRRTIKWSASDAEKKNIHTLVHNTNAVQQFQNSHHWIVPWNDSKKKKEIVLTWPVSARASKTVWACESCCLVRGDRITCFNIYHSLIVWCHAGIQTLLSLSCWIPLLLSCNDMKRARLRTCVHTHFAISAEFELNTVDFSLLLFCSTIRQHFRIVNCAQIQQHSLNRPQSTRFDSTCIQFLHNIIASNSTDNNVKIFIIIFIISHFYIHIFYFFFFFW